MPMLRTLAIGMVVGLVGGLPMTAAQACDNDRYPCPIVSQTQNAPDATARPSTSRKKASRSARQDERARANTDGQTSQAASRTKATGAAGQEEAPVPRPQKTADPARALNNEVGRDESPVAAAAAAWLVLPATADAGVQATAGEEATPAAPANEVRVVDPKEVNELDLAAASAVPAESSWLSYLLMTLGAALAAASAVRC